MVRFIFILPMAGIAAALALVLLQPSAPSFAADVINSPDTEGQVGSHTSLALDDSGNPVVSYFDTTDGGLNILHCDDPNCAAGGDSITTADTEASVGLYTSLVLDSSGNPVVSYYDQTNDDLKILHCDDPNCAGAGDSVTTPDTTGDVGQYTSLQLDGSGNPVVSYYDATNGDLKLLHCDDPECAAGGDSITSPDTSGLMGLFTSLELDASGNPVVSYWALTNGDFKLLHCNDPNCASGGDSITFPDTNETVGLYTSLVLDSSGNPVVSYYDQTNDDLKILHCDDPNCAAGGDSVTSPDTTGSVDSHTSLALDALGNPTVTYYDSTNHDLNLLHCNDPNCAPGGDSVEVVDADGDVGQYSSLALDAFGNPVVSYHDFASNFDLKLLHCDDPDCDPSFTAPTPTATATATATATVTPTPTATPTPTPTPCPDNDGDGWTDCQESFIGTDAQNDCTPNGWPPDPEPAPDGNGVVQIDDITFAAGAFGSTTTPRAEIAGQNGVVQIDDIAAFANRFGQSC